MIKDKTVEEIEELLWGDTNEAGYGSGEHGEFTDPLHESVLERLYEDYDDKKREDKFNLKSKIKDVLKPRAKESSG